MRRLILLASVAIALAAPATALAHPLGNFTINRHSRIEISGDHLYVVYVLDLAEIPTFQARQTGIDAKVYARRIAAGTTVTVEGRPAHLRPVTQVLAFPRGAAGLQTTRLEVLLAGPKLHGVSEVVYHDNNYADRIGWSEVIARASGGAHLLEATVPATSKSAELRAYPKDLLQSPLRVTSAHVRVEGGGSAGPEPTLSSGSTLQAPDRIADSGFTRLVARDRLSAGVIAISLLLALFWGAAHAFTPGHGKSIVAAYLVGSRGTPRHAVLLGLIVTVTHTVGVFALGIVTLALSQFIVPADLYPWLNLASALLVVAVGLGVLRARIRSMAHARAHARGHEHHHHDHSHEHVPPNGSGLRGLVGVGVSGGLLPCPTALVVLLAAISLHRVGYGLVLIVAFSLGLAASVTGIGLVAVTAKRFFARKSFDGRLIRALPAISAVVVLVLGLAMTFRALPGLP
ncbi:MAG: nickel/cobalt transporter (NicO) family protein [Gaiellaceae bacterium]|jgi:ABC-type nickel/cobalt efflux system permease component RcnA|nr:nickel/cobalt transporter (NicO) family protein [Gaiellaceae bacterium]